MARSKKSRKKAAKKKPTTPRPRKGVGGAPSKYDPAYADKVTMLCKLGATDKEIAEFFNVEESTINNWKLAHPEFLESLKKGKIIADAEVANALHKRAVGYKYDEVTFEKLAVNETGMSIDEEGDIGATKVEAYKRKVITKEVPPDVAAANIWLKNRRGKVDKAAQRWADKVETGITDTEGNDVPVTIFELPNNGRSKTEDNSTTGRVPDENPGKSS